MHDTQRPGGVRRGGLVGCVCVGSSRPGSGSGWVWVFGARPSRLGQNSRVPGIFCICVVCVSTFVLPWGILIRPVHIHIMYFPLSYAYLPLRTVYSGTYLLYIFTLYRTIRT
ncbi:hypothetical protein C8F01DRAFT_142791 [Mycena amicta]|nr:hypothetical protein C8F01DRAFT_142791 [Mycena amicta]